MECLRESKEVFSLSLNSPNRAEEQRDNSYQVIVMGSSSSPSLGSALLIRGNAQRDLSARWFKCAAALFPNGSAIFVFETLTSESTNAAATAALSPDARWLLKTASSFAKILGERRRSSSDAVRATKADSPRSRRAIAT